MEFEVSTPCVYVYAIFRQRPYCIEYTRSHPNSEVKRCKARSVLGWGTAWEVLRVLLALFFPPQNDFHLHVLLYLVLSQAHDDV